MTLSRCSSTLGLLFIAALARAEDPAPAPTPRPWTGAAQVSFLRTSGNTDVSVLGLGAEVKHKADGPWAVGAKGLFNRGSLNGQQNLKNLALAVRGSRAIDKRTDFFVEGGYIEDKYAGIESRTAGEIGLARKLSITEPHLFALEVGFGLAHEVRLPGQTSQDFGFGRGGFTYKYVISKTADFQNQANYISNLKQSSDWRFTNVAALTAALRGKFSLKLIHSVNHLNAPPLGKKKTDTTIAAALVAKF
jgi:putative salt-induced outer membrane protein YdiY